MGVSFCFLTTNHRVFLKKLILYTHCEHTSYIIIIHFHWKYCRNKGVPLCVKLCNYPVMDWQETNLSDVWSNEENTARASINILIFVVHIYLCVCVHWPYQPQPRLGWIVPLHQLSQLLHTQALHTTLVCILKYDS